MGFRNADAAALLCEHHGAAGNFAHAAHDGIRIGVIFQILEGNDDGNPNDDIIQLGDSEDEVAVLSIR